MSRSVGSQLPEELLERLLGADPGQGFGEAVVLVTVDPYGRPHPALVSYAELLALDPARLRLVLYAGTRSGAHLRDAGRATLVFADAELVLYVKADAVALAAAPGHPGLARFELHVRDVLSDRAAGDEAGAHLTGALAFHWPGGLDAWVRHRLQQRAALLT